MLCYNCRLEGRLKKYSLCERNIKGDGNCQFRAGEQYPYVTSKPVSSFSPLRLLHCDLQLPHADVQPWSAVADQLYRDSKYHLDVRRIAVHQLRSNPSTYSQFVPTGI